MGTTDGNGVYTPDLDEEGWDPELVTNFDLFSQNITDQAAHVADTTDAHDASAVSFTPTGTVAATDVQAAIAEVASEAAAAGAPTTADYLVGTTQGGLSAEIVVGATPGGELGGTWASPTVDATHSGSAHHAAATEGTGIDISGQVISVDLSEISAGGELGGTMDAPTVDSSHAGGTHAATQAAAESTAATAASTHAAAADPHTGYQKESEKAAASGYASLDGSTKVPVAQLPTGTSSSTVALGDAAAALDATHAAAGDPHTAYLLESAAAAVATSGSASDLGTGTLPIARVADGAVTLAKLADMVTARIVGRVTAGTGVPELLTAAQVATFVNPSLPHSGALTADVTTSETTTSTTYADLATSGPSVTATIGASGMALVLVSSQMSHPTASQGVRASVSIAGAAASDEDAALAVNSSSGGLNSLHRPTRPILATGLTPGSVTFTMKYRVVTGGTGTFSSRRIIVIPL